MKVCLIRPPIVVPVKNIMVLYTPPIGLAYVAGAVRAAGFDVTFIDALGEALNVRTAWKHDTILHGMLFQDIIAAIPKDVGLIGVHAGFTFDWPACRHLIGMIREAFPDVLIVAGGEHATAMAERSLRESSVDFIVRGEGEETAVELARAVERHESDFLAIAGLAYLDRETGLYTETASRARRRDIDDIVPPAWDISPIHKYLDGGYGYGVNRGRSMPVVASRGCPYQCTFCSNPNMWTTRWVIRSVDNLLDEIEFYRREYMATNFDFFDLTFVLKKQWIIDFCQKIVERGLAITWQLPAGTRSEAIDSEVASWLYKAGCRNVTYAPESGSIGVLTRIKKKIDPISLAKSIADCVSQGINVKVNMIFGFPGETMSEILESYRFIVRLAASGAHDLSIWGFSPYPGSAIFDDMVQQGSIVLDADYYDKLRTYSDASNTTSFCENFSSARLKRLRFLGRVIFYLVSWSLRPWRPLMTIRNVILDKPESRMDMGLSDLLRGRKAGTG